MLKPGIALLYLSLFSLPVMSQQLMRIGTGLWPGYEPIYYAQSLGKFQGQNVRIIQYQSTSEVIRAFKNKSLEIAALTLDEAISLRESNIPFKIFLVCNISNGGDVILAKPELNDITQLKGKRVAVESSTVGAYLLTRALQLNSLALSDIDLINMDISSTSTALKHDLADAYVTFEPKRTQLLKTGLIEIFSSKQIPGEIVDVLVVQQSFYENHAERIQLLVDGWFFAVQQMRINPTKAHQFVAQRMHLSVVEVAELYAGLILTDQEYNQRMLGGVSPKLKVVLQQVETLMLEINLLQKPVDILNDISDKFVN